MSNTLGTTPALTEVTPRDILPIGFDYTPALPSGVTLSSATGKLFIRKTGQEYAAGLVSATASTVSPVATLTVTGLVAGTEYVLECLGVYSNGTRRAARHLLRCAANQEG